jgi:hypothetical protein
LLDVVGYGQQLAIVCLRSESIVLGLEPEHHCFQIGDAPAKSMIFFDEANVVAAHISKESLGHECFLHETLLVAQLPESSNRNRLTLHAHGASRLGE